MEHPTRRKAGLALAIVATLAATPTAATAAAPSAGDEYVLEIPGVRQAESLGVASTGAPDREPREQLGVVGETEPPESPLASLGDAVAAIPASLLAGLAALLALTLVALPRRHGAPAAR
jgi:hypothetical protein